MIPKLTVPIAFPKYYYLFLVLSDLIILITAISFASDLLRVNII